MKRNWGRTALWKVAAALGAAALAVLVLLEAFPADDSGQDAASGAEASSQTEIGQEAEELLESAGVSFPAGASADSVESYEVDESLETAAAELMKDYQARQDCILLEARYIDLLGNVWGFSVEGAGWVDVCIMRDAGSDATSVEIVHMETESTG